MRHSEQHAARSDAGVGSSSCMSQKDTPMLLLKVEIKHRVLLLERSKAGNR